jgi:hypothetical protein
MDFMASLRKYLAIGIAALLLIILLVGFLALSEPYVKGLSKGDLFNQSNQTDLIVSVSENFINSILQSELEERKPQGVRNVTVFLNEDGPVEVLAELEVSVGIATLRPEVKVEANLTAENNTLQVRPELIAIGKLNLPRSIWIGPLNTAMTAVEDAANQATASVLQKGFKITGVYIGDHYITMTVNAPPPEELRKVLAEA